MGSQLAQMRRVQAERGQRRRPQVFDVDLKAILARGDDKTNIRLEAYDQVYVGETARSNWAKYLPPSAQSHYTKKSPCR